MRFSVGVLTIAFFLPGIANSQTVRTLSPDSEFPEDFSMVSGLRELSDGRLLVTDALGQMLMWVDMDEGYREQIGREGAGPEEYRTPDALYALSNDSTLMVDLGNGRLTVLDSEGSFVRTMPISRQVGSETVIALPRGVDSEGRVYYRPFGMTMMRPGGGIPTPPDSAAIARWNPAGNTIDTLGMAKLRERKVSTSGSANNRNISVEAVRLSPQDAWGVAPDGRVAVARSDGYSLEWIDEDSSVRGNQVPFEPVRVGRAEKLEYVKAGSRGGLSVGVTINNGARTTSFGRGGGSSDEPDITGEWPATMPPFAGDVVRVAPNGDAWVRRNTASDEESTFDVFGADGNLREQIKFPVGRQVVGFGNGVVYAVYFDEFDLQYLERYPLSSTASPSSRNR